MEDRKAAWDTLMRCWPMAAGCLAASVSDVPIDSLAVWRTAAGRNVSDPIWAW